MSENEKKRILVLGGDGYLGWPCARYFAERGHQVVIVDNCVRRAHDHELGTDTLLPIGFPAARQRVMPDRIAWRDIDIADTLNRDFIGLHNIFMDFNPEVVIHFAEQRSAPYSMCGRTFALYTQRNNVLGTLNVLYLMKEFTPDAHLIKLGTMGEYGTPNIDIEEGFIEIEHRGRRDVLPFPKQPGSWYHLTKVHDSNNIMFACKIWGLKATDLNQGVVYGAETAECPADSPLCTRLDYDDVFGTVINRFCVQAAIGMPLTIYGKGGQTRGYIDIRDSMRCIELAMANPPGGGSDEAKGLRTKRRAEPKGLRTEEEQAQSSALSPHGSSLRPHGSPLSPIPTFQVFNQITEVFDINTLAAMVQEAAEQVGITPPGVQHIDNPRVEAEDHYYKVDYGKFKVLGLEARRLADAIPRIIELALKHKARILQDTIMPEVTWK